MSATVAIAPPAPYLCDALCVCLLDDDIVAVGTDAGGVYTSDVRAPGRLLAHASELHDGPVWCLAAAPASSGSGGGGVLLSGGDDGQLRATPMSALKGIPPPRGSASAPPSSEAGGSDALRCATSARSRVVLRSTQPLLCISAARADGGVTAAGDAAGRLHATRLLVSARP